MDHFVRLFAVSVALAALTSAIRGLPIADGVHENENPTYTTAGRTIQLSCTTSVSGYTFEYWTHHHPNVTEIIDSGGRFTVSSYRSQGIYQLIINDVRLEDNGTYKCVFTNASGVTVARCIDVLYQNPVEFLTPDHQMFYFFTGFNVSLECRAKYYEQIQWKNPDMELIDNTVVPSSRVHTVEKESGITLIFKELLLQDKGTYYCVAKNVVTNKKMIRISIQVYALPSVIVTPSMATSRESENVSLTCNATGYPLPHVVWYKGSLNNPPLNTSEVSVTDEYIVSVLDLYLQDSAIYYCVASNPNGSNTAYASLNIIYCKSFPEQIEAHLIGHLSINVTWHPPVCYDMEYQNTLTITWWMMSSHSVQSYIIQDPVNINHYVITNLEPGATYFIVVTSGTGTSNVVNVTTGIEEHTSVSTIAIGTTIGVVFLLLCSVLVLIVYCIRIQRKAKKGMIVAASTEGNARSANDAVAMHMAGRTAATFGEVEVQEEDCIRCGSAIPMADCTAYRGVKVQETCPRVPHQHFDTTSSQTPDSSFVVTGFTGLSSDIILIPSTSICILDLIGQGEFGIVFKAHLENPHTLATAVAVKTLKGFLSHEKVSELLTESMKMKDFDHPNVLSLIGICVDGGPAPYIVMPFMANGSLLSYLKKERENLIVSSTANRDLEPVTQKKLLDILLQIAKGMEYLTGKGVLHRDLAARNCMIDSGFCIKVADFGMSESVYSKDYFRHEIQSEAKLPVKWMAPESLSDGIFTEKTDVWSFGVTFWEVCTGGKIPYPAVSPWSLPQLLEQGQRLIRPLNAACTDDMHSVMESCWDADPQQRPSFSKLVSTFVTHLSTLSDYLQL